MESLGHSANAALSRRTKSESERAPASAALQAASISGRSRPISARLKRHRKEEDAAVPEIFAGGEVALGRLGIGLFDKARHREGTRGAVERRGRRRYSHNRSPAARA